MTQRPTSTPPPYRTLEAVRGLASFWVVCFHAALLMGLAHPDINTTWGIGLLHNGYLGVQVFFVVSGYCIAGAACSSMGKPRPVWSFAAARLRRIFPPCWASLILVAGASFFAAWLGLKDTSLAKLDLPHQSAGFFIKNLTLTQLAAALPHRAPEGSFISEVCWTLCYEMAFYLVVGLILAAVLIGLRRTGDAAIKTMLNVSHAITLICCVILIVRPTALVYPFDLWAQFGLGVVVFDIVRQRQSPRAWAFYITISALLIVFLFCQNVRIGQTQQPSIDTFATALAAAVILLACHSLDARIIALPPIRIAAFVGTFSYSLYLVNFLLISGLTRVYQRLPLPAWTRLPAIFCIVLAVLPLAWLFFRCFEKPFIKSRTVRAAIAPARTTPPAQVPDVAAPVGPAQ